MLRAPRLAGVRADYDRILKQRNSLLKTARCGATRLGLAGPALSTLGVWDAHLARAGAELLAERLRLVEPLRPYVGHGLRRPSPGARRATTPGSTTSRASTSQERTRARRRCTRPARWRELERRRGDELDRGISLVGPHRDELLLSLGNGERRLPVKGYASHGESWSFALALRLASYDLLRADGDDPILILDDVFAELDSERRVAARRAGRRRRAGAGHRGGRRRRARGAGRHALVVGGGEVRREP